MPLDLQRVLAEKIRRRDLVDMPDYRIGALARLAEADQTFVRMDVHPHVVGILAKLQRFDGRDLHGGASAAREGRPAV